MRYIDGVYNKWVTFSTGKTTDIKFCRIKSYNSYYSTLFKHHTNLIKRRSKIRGPYIRPETHMESINQRAKKVMPKQIK